MCYLTGSWRKAAKWTTLCNHGVKTGTFHTYHMSTWGFSEADLSRHHLSHRWPLPRSLTRFTLRRGPARPRAMWQHFCCNCSALSHAPSAAFHYFQTHELKQFVCSAQSAVAFDVSSPVLRWCSLANNQCFCRGGGGAGEGWEHKIEVTTSVWIINSRKVTKGNNRCWCTSRKHFF